MGYRSRILMTRNKTWYALISRKMLWIRRWINSRWPLQKALLAAAC